MKKRIIAKDDTSVITFDDFVELSMHEVNSIVAVSKKYCLALIAYDINKYAWINVKDPLCSIYCPYSSVGQAVNVILAEGFSVSMFDKEDEYLQFINEAVEQLKGKK